MLESTKKQIASAKMLALGQMAAIVVALVAFLVCQFAVGKENLGFAPVWMLFIVFFYVSGGITLAYGIINKLTINNLIGGVMLILATAVLLAVLKIMKGWIILVITLVLIVVLFVSTFVTKASTLAIEFDNAPDSGRKSYAERQAEKEEAKANEPKPEMPEIKSFKD